MNITQGTKLALICEELKLAIEKAYDQGISIPEAERLAVRTLTVRLELADQIKNMSIDSKMKKHGAKAVRAAAYMEEITKHEKKPAEAYLENAVNLSDSVRDAEQVFAESEAEFYNLQAYLDIFKDAHLHFRNVSKGSFEG